MRNLATDASAVGVTVNFLTSQFGIGMKRQPLGAQVVNLSPEEELLLKFPLTENILGGEQRIGTYVRLEHPHDSVQINNAGDQVHDGAMTSEAGRSIRFTLPVLNDSNVPETLTLEVLGSALNASVTPPSRSFGPFEQFTANVDVTVPPALHGTSENYLTHEVTVTGRRSNGELVGGATFVIRVND